MVYEEESGDITLAFTGDCFVNRRFSMYREERFLELVKLMRDADATFSITESMFHNFEAAPIPDAQGYGTYVHCDPAVIEDLKWMGIDAVSTANIHCAGYGEGGIIANIDHLDRHNMPHAGTGKSLTEAVSPVYLDTPKGSVALMGVTLTMPDLDWRAGDARGRTINRAGPNVVRRQTTNVVPQATFDTLVDAARGLSMGRVLQPGATTLNFAGQRYEVGESYDRKVVPNQFDWDLNMRWVREARRMAEWVVVAIYSFEPGATGDEPNAMHEAFARACIDNGADAIFGTGPHRDKGIEIYKGKPIVYSLATLFYQNEVIKQQPTDFFVKYGLGPDATPADAYDVRTGNDSRVDPVGFQSAVVEARYEAKQLVEIVLHPVDAGFYTGKRTIRGRPVIAEGPVADEVLTRIQKLSEPYGTKVEIANGRGTIKVG